MEKFNLYNMPKTIRQHKKSQITNFLKNILENIYQKFSKNEQIFKATWKKFISFPKLLKLWKTLQYEWFNATLN
jgi:hypothetical protein